MNNEDLSVQLQTSRVSKLVSGLSLHKHLPRMQKSCGNCRQCIRKETFNRQGLKFIKDEAENNPKLRQELTKMHNDFVNNPYWNCLKK